MSNNTISRVTAKQFRLFIKEGDTPETLQEHYKCTEDDIKNRLRQIYHRNQKEANKIYDELKANRKKPKPRHKIFEPEKRVYVAPTHITENEGQQETTAELRQEEERLSNDIINLEIEHKSLAQTHHEQIKALRNLQDKISAIHAMLQDCHDEYIKIVETANEVAEKMNSISGARREKMSKLEAIRHELDERRRLVIFVYQDGNIEVQDNPDSDSVVDDSGYLELKQNLIERKECEDLRVRDTITLARLLKICERAEKVALVFEDEKLEIAFKAIRQEA